MKTILTAGLILLALILDFFSVVPVSAHAAEADTPVLDIQGEKFRAVVIAVPKAIAGYPIPSNTWMNSFDQRLRSAIAFHGALAPLDRDAEFKDPSPFGSFKANVWSASGAEMLLTTQLVVDSEANKASADIHLFDIGSAESVLSRRFKISNGSSAELADAVAGAVIELLLGLKSPFAQPLAFQYRKPGQKWRELYTTQWDGSHVKQRTNNQKLILHPAFMSGKNQIIAIGYRGRQPGLRFFDLSKSTEQVLLRSSTTIHGPTPFRDQQRITFAWERNKNTDIYILDLLSGKWERMTTSTSADLSPAVSPDGKKIAFISDRRGNPYLYILDVETKETEPLILEGTYLGEPDWSSDGKRLVFVRRDRGTGFAIWTYEFTTKRLTRITENLGDTVESPAWAPDNRTIIFSNLDGKSYDIWKVDRLLKKTEKLTNLPGDARMPTWRSY